MPRITTCVICSDRFSDDIPCLRQISQMGLENIPSLTNKLDANTYTCLHPFSLAFLYGLCTGP